MCEWDWTSTWLGFAISFSNFARFNWTEESDNRRELSLSRRSSRSNQVASDLNIKEKWREREREREKWKWREPCIDFSSYSPTLMNNNQSIDRINIYIELTYMLFDFFSLCVCVCVCECVDDVAKSIRLRWIHQLSRRCLIGGASRVIQWIHLISIEIVWRWPGMIRSIID